MHPALSLPSPRRPRIRRAEDIIRKFAPAVPTEKTPLLPYYIAVAVRRMVRELKPDELGYDNQRIAVKTENLGPEGEHDVPASGKVGEVSRVIQRAIVTAYGDYYADQYGGQSKSDVENSDPPLKITRELHATIERVLNEMFGGYFPLNDDQTAIQSFEKGDRHSSVYACDYDPELDLLTFARVENIGIDPREEDQLELRALFAKIRGVNALPPNEVTTKHIVWCPHGGDYVVPAFISNFVHKKDAQLLVRLVSVDGVDERPAREIFDQVRERDSNKTKLKT